MKLFMAAALLMLSSQAAMAQTAAPPDLAAASTRLEAELVAKHGETERPRIRQGLAQAGRFWRVDDGDAAAFEKFARAHFAGDAKARDALFARFEHNLEQLHGHYQEVNREFRVPVDLDLGPVQPADEIFSAFDPWAHHTDDFFANKLAFAVLLNFPLTTLEERLAAKGQWSRRQWAETRLAERYGKRVPAEVNRKIGEATAAAERYIGEYNVWMHHVLDADGRRLFPPKLRLLSHWNLRDEIKAQYSASDADGLARQRVIQKVMERIVAQQIPAIAINNPAVDWNPYANTVASAAMQDVPDVAPFSGTPPDTPEADTRYATLLGNFRAFRLADPYTPTMPTTIARRFEEDRQIPEARVKAMLEQVLTSPQVMETAQLIQQRLGRPLEPFDIWYNGFRPRGGNTEAQLDMIVRKRYPSAAAYQKDMPRQLRQLGFSDARAQYLTRNIATEAARGSGHAMGAQMRGERARLRTRVEKEGMNYKGFNIAVHELGHNVEQTFSLNDIDHWLLNGVPNNAFTEALAFVFQAHDFELLGLAKPDAQSQALKTLNDFWATYEIGGVALVDIAVWHWMYDHPDAKPAELREATLTIARDIWNRYYAPVLGQQDSVLLGIYSHMINYPLYLPDYPIGHMIAFQIEQQMEKAGNVGREFERMSKIGKLTPDEWMEQASGRPVGPEALLDATVKALRDVQAAPLKKPAVRKKKS